MELKTYFSPYDLQSKITLGMYLHSTTKHIHLFYDVDKSVEFDKGDYTLSNIRLDDSDELIILTSGEAHFDYGVYDEDGIPHLKLTDVEYLNLNTLEIEANADKLLTLTELDGMMIVINLNDITKDVHYE